MDRVEALTAGNAVDLQRIERHDAHRNGRGDRFNLNGLQQLLRHADAERLFRQRHGKGTSLQ